MKTRILAVIMAALMTMLSICSALPAAALSGRDAGYNAEEIALLRDFLETEDAEGVKIGEKLNPGVYDPDDPETWSGVVWTEVNSELRAEEIHLYQTNICGPIVIPGCEYLQKVNCMVNRLTSVDISACSALTELYVGSNELTGLDISACRELLILDCENNMIESIDFSGCPKLTEINCGVNKLKRIDVSGCPLLSRLDCHENDLRGLDLSGHTELVELHASGNLLENVELSGCTHLRNLDLYPNRNRLVELDLSDCPELYFDHIEAEGNGHIGHMSVKTPDDPWMDAAMAAPNPGEDFIGWFDENGELISTSLNLFESETDCRNVIARFTGTPIVYGDCNGDGVVNAADAVLVLRSVLGLSGDSADLTAGADVDGNGVIDAADAVLILRVALGVA